VTASSIVRRSVLLGLAGLSLYLLAPSLIEVFSEAPKLGTIEPLWFVPMVGFEAASLVCMAVVQRICLKAEGFGPVLSSSLAGNAMAKVVPGGGAAGVALQYAMLTTNAGLTGGQVASALTGANLLSFATLLALPVLTLPAILAGLPVAHGLVQAAWLGGGGFVVMSLAGAALLALDAPLVTVGRLAERVHNRLARRRSPITGLAARLLHERDVVLQAVGERWWQALLASVARWGFDYAALVTALAAVGAHPSPSLVLLAYVGGQVLSQIPVTPGGLGFVEAGLTGLLALAGVGAADAALATLAYRLVSYWLPLPAGAVAWYIDRADSG
jgi:uncharacterized membrane protein YbhN (UPF0104 family)